MMSRLVIAALQRALCALCALPAALVSQDKLADVTKSSQNPISAIASVPLQSNWNYRNGVPERLQYVLDVQPSVPIGITDDMSLIARMIAPIVKQPVGTERTETGMGDLTVQTFFAPTRPADQGFIWGFGPAFTAPTASSSVLGSDRWSAGVGTVIVLMPDPWVLGV